ncbi:MAG: hypothetical protein DMD35_18190 [Gemmatimonadetes bacterium]|nr:MAG: hypothetical protein DMD35_18190 [Gemmatimonadota bacterium]
MRAIAVGTAALLLSVASPAFAHRTDEYLQATTIAVEKDRLAVQMRLAPGIEVFPRVLALIDADGDGAVTEGELRAYAQRLTNDLSLSVDGVRLPLRLVSSKMEALEALEDGRGTIQLAFDAAAPRGSGGRRLVFENHHQRPMAEYLVNGLVPRDPAIRLGAQRRNYDQSVYRLDYTQSGAVASTPSDQSWSRMWWWLAVAALIPLTRLTMKVRMGQRRGRLAVVPPREN